MSATSAKKRRVTVKIPDPNPLFVQWLTEWKEKAQMNNSKLQHTFSNALHSLKKYPLPLETGKDCKILHGFGDKLCKMLDDKLAKHSFDDPNLKQQLERNGPGTSANVSDSNDSGTPNKEYVPQKGSGAFAILVTLYEKSLELNYKGFLTKAEVIDFGQSLSKNSFTKPEPNSRYTAWSSMRTLLEKKLVTKKSNPAKFSLTDEGVELAEKLHIHHRIDVFEKENTSSVRSTVQFNPDEPWKDSGEGSSGLCKDNRSSRLSNKLESRVPSSSSTTSSVKSGKSLSRHTSSTSTKSTESIFESVIFAPNSFDIVLLVDTQEVGSNNPDPNKDPIISELINIGVKYEIRDLKVGDYTWICRRGGQTNEIILPYVIERKRMDDLGHSIKDGRFYEQKHRLKQCGLKNLIYLVESHGKNEHLGLPTSSILQGAINTLVQDEFTLKFTENTRETCYYLSCMTDLITKLFKDKTLVSCTKEDLPELRMDDDLLCLMEFKEFNRNSLKNKQFTARDMFIKHLLQIKTMSFDKALAITEKYPTPRLLKDAYADLDSKQGETLLAKIKSGNPAKNLGPALSKTIYQFYCNDFK